ncbi:MAG: DUF2516 family protein [Pseudonocardia sp.]
MSLLFALDTYILRGLWLAAIPVGGYAFVHALRQRADAFTAADKLTKPAWLGITGASAVLLLILYNSLGGGILSLFWLASLIAALVYIVDVKPAVIGVQGGGQRW